MDRIRVNYVLRKIPLSTFCSSSLYIKKAYEKLSDIYGASIILLLIQYVTQMIFGTYFSVCWFKTFDIKDLSHFDATDANEIATHLSQFVIGLSRFLYLTSQVSY